MKTVNQLIARANNLSIKYKPEDLIGITAEELHSLTRTINTLRHDLDKATKSIARERQLSTSIYANAMLECDKNRFEERV